MGYDVRKPATPGTGDLTVRDRRDHRGFLIHLRLATVDGQDG